MTRALARATQLGVAFASDANIADVANAHTAGAFAVPMTLESAPGNVTVRSAVAGIARALAVATETMAGAAGGTRRLD